MANVVKHKFQSAKADGLDATLVRPSNWNEEHAFAGGADGNLLMRDSSESDGASWVQGLPVTLTNKTGEQLVAGDVVALDADNDGAVAYDDTKAAVRPYVVTYRTINDDDDGPFIGFGRTPALVTGTVTRGHYLYKSATNAALEDSGVAANGTNPPPTGAVAIAEESAVGPGTNIIEVFFFGVPYRRAHGRHVFEASGEFTAPAGVTEVMLTLVGGGGGGGSGGSGASAAGAAGGGGGGGGGQAGSVVRGRISVTPGQTYTVTVGRGGVGGAGASGVAGNSNGNNGQDGQDGEDTSFQGFPLVAKGGKGGKAGARGTGGGGSGPTPVAAGGAAHPEIGWVGVEASGKGGDSGGDGSHGAITSQSGGDTATAKGGDGGPFFGFSGFAGGGGGGAAGGSNAFGGIGGDGSDGQGGFDAGPGNRPPAPGPGSDGSGYGGGGGGSGGSGGACDSNGSNGTAKGGDGADGVCIVEW